MRFGIAVFGLFLLISNACNPACSAVEEGGRGMASAASLYSAPTANIHLTLGGRIPYTLQLSIKDYINRVNSRNERIFNGQLEWEISAEGVRNAESIFEPELVTSYLYDYSKTQNTVEELLSRQFAPLYWKNNQIYNLTIEKLLPTGARVQLGYRMNNILDSLADPARQYQTFAGGSVTQPLLRNGGFKATRASIVVAEADRDIAFQNYRREMTQVIYNAAAAYWDLALAQGIYRIREESLRVANEIVRDNTERVRVGKMAQTELYEAQAGLAVRKSALFAAQQELYTAMNNLKIFYSSSAIDENVVVVAADSPEPLNIRIDFVDNYTEATRLRPEYLAALLKVEKEGVRVSYAENQRWPQLDLIASYGLNGLASSFSDSWFEATSNEYESYSLGLEFRIPLGGGTKSRSELEAARKRKRQALLELKASEVSLANGLAAAIKNLESTEEQAVNFKRAIDLNSELLRVELARLSAGKSSSRGVLEKEENLNQTKERYIQSRVNAKKAELYFMAVKGSLLLDHDIEVMEIKKIGSSPD